MYIIAAHFMGKSFLRGNIMQQSQFEALIKLLCEQATLPQALELLKAAKTRRLLKRRNRFQVSVVWLKSKGSNVFTM